MIDNQDQSRRIAMLEAQVQVLIDSMKSKTEMDAKRDEAAILLFKAHQEQRELVFCIFQRVLDRLSTHLNLQDGELKSFLAKLESADERTQHLIEKLLPPPENGTLASHAFLDMFAYHLPMIAGGRTTAS